MQSKFLISALEGISAKDAIERLNTKANHVAWITGSVVSGRYYLAHLLGIDQNSSTGALFKNNQGIVDDAIYPSPEAFKSDWEHISPVLETALLRAGDEVLDKKIKMGDMEMTIFDMVSFTCYREANCIGQIALWRRLLDYPAMKYM